MSLYLAAVISFYRSILFPAVVMVVANVAVAVVVVGDIYLCFIKR